MTRWVNGAERKRSTPSVNATLPLSNVQARPPAGAVRPMISRRQGDSGVLPGAAQEPPLPSAGWGYLKSDTAALPLESGRCYTVGRRPDSDLVLKSEHAMLEVDGSGRTAALRDLGSLNGCFLNNVRLRDTREPLRHGDNVRFGFDSRVWTVDCTGETP
ncbi:hypothetical protein EMIHUDRAFT_196672 [Emiliania huxleyi CCMP1516]|uniref:FHA domain-containing protein n=2 Tax=Emiliania huxleyi TaxID=2903 RepID=A0A0D3J4I4_EMIH1|nr:hypothetical protein EMIHUDRAFT_196672 [Emiliania huxleyi CCMP1516]EOD18419.1 hypothetical protein EMIHUDRAFT_196672 [Emiliania huxleyi CCMP1516]|eukprot:XP_005770848.1 hypothetical protein EMIHUDRAFT_196672 [Emiliania huxleyi CCMP1516]